MFLAAAFVFLNAIVPPFQNPDEPHHFAAAVIHARGEGARAAVESGVIRMMDKANWWRLEGIGRPARLPARISDIEFLMEGSKSDDFRTRLSRFEFWHRLAGRLMRPLAGASLELLYYLCRAASSLFMLGAYVLLWKMFGILASAFGPAVRWGFVFLLVLPQFLLTATAVSPDAFVILMGAAFFYGAAELIAGGCGLVRKGNNWRSAGGAALIVLLSAAAFLTDRSAVVFAALALPAALLVIRKDNAGRVVPGVLAGAVAAILAAYFIAVRYPLEVERVLGNVMYVARGSGAAALKLFGEPGFALRFWVFAADGFLLKFGWLVFGAPGWIYGIWRALAAAAVFGLVVRLVKGAGAGRAMNEEAGAGKMAEGGGDQAGAAGDAAGGAARFRIRWTLLALAAVGIQALGTWVFYGANGQLGQGRYFFPVAAPAVFLLVLGLHAFGEFLARDAGRTVLAGTVLAEILLLTYAIWARVIPAFHLILRGPHPGV